MRIWIRIPAGNSQVQHLLEATAMDAPEEHLPRATSPLPEDAQPSSREKIRVINRAILAEDRRLRQRYPILAQQDFLGLGIFCVALLIAALVREAYLEALIPWWLTIPLVALPISILHELEHDLIHNQYFKHRRGVQHAMLAGIWLNKLSINPWFRRDIHLFHHKVSGQKEDIEERLIGLGLRPGILRLLVTVWPVGTLLLIPRIKRDSPTFRVMRMVVLSFPALMFSGATLQAFLKYYRQGWFEGVAMGSELPVWGFQLSIDLMVMLVAPAMLRQSCIAFISSYSHYYDDIPRQDVFYQNQVLNHPIFWPFQLFCFNFGATHILHHYIVDQPFYLRQLVAKEATKVLIEQGVRVNDFGVFRHSNRWHRPARSSAQPALTS